MSVNGGGGFKQGKGGVEVANRRRWQSALTLAAKAKKYFGMLYLC